MKKILKILIFLFLPFCFTSCFDYVQSITYKNGQYYIYEKLTVFKPLLAMVEENPESFFSSIKDETFDYLPENVNIKKVNTELELGYECAFSINPKTQVEKEKVFLPKINGNKYIIPFLTQSKNDFSTEDLDEFENMNSEGEGFLTALFSTAKFRILVSKKIIPQVSLAYIEGKASQNYSVPVYDYGDSYCFEIPFIVLMEMDMYNLERIIVLKEV